MFLICSQDVCRRNFDEQQSERKSADRLAFAHFLRTGQRLTTAEWLAGERKFNPYHDPHDGRFTFGPGGSGAGGSSASMASRPANGGKPYPVRVDFDDIKKPQYPVRIEFPTSTVQRKKPAPAKRPAPPAIRFRQRDGIDLPPQVVANANTLSDSIHLRTGYGIVVTSGRRGPARQAEAMYDNYADRTAKPYTNASAERDVKRAFDQGRAAGKSRNQVIGDMTNVLTAQVNRGVLISRHMSSKAIDIETPPAKSCRLSATIHQFSRR